MMTSLRGESLSAAVRFAPLIVNRRHERRNLHAMKFASVSPSGRPESQLCTAEQNIYKARYICSKLSILCERTDFAASFLVSYR